MKRLFYLFLIIAIISSSCATEYASYGYKKDYDGVYHIDEPLFKIDNSGTIMSAFLLTPIVSGVVGGAVIDVEGAGLLSLAAGTILGIVWGYYLVKQMKVNVKKDEIGEWINLNEEKRKKKFLLLGHSTVAGEKVSQIKLLEENKDISYIYVDNVNIIINFNKLNPNSKYLPIMVDSYLKNRKFVDSKSVKQMIITFYNKDEKLVNKILDFYFKKYRSSISEVKELISYIPKKRERELCENTNVYGVEVKNLTRAGKNGQPGSRRR